MEGGRKEGRKEGRKVDKAKIRYGKVRLDKFSLGAR